MAIVDVRPRIARAVAARTSRGESQTVLRLEVWSELEAAGMWDADVSDVEVDEVVADVRALHRGAVVTVVTLGSRVERRRIEWGGR